MADDLVVLESGELARPEVKKALAPMLIKAAANWSREFPTAVVLEAICDLDPQDFAAGCTRLLREETFPPVAATFRKHILAEQDAREARERAERRAAQERYDAETRDLFFAWSNNPTQDPQEAADRLGRAITWPIPGVTNRFSHGSSIAVEAGVVHWRCRSPRHRGVDNVCEWFATMAPTVTLAVQCFDGDRQPRWAPSLPPTISITGWRAE